VLTADHTSGQVDPEYLTSLGHYAVPIIIYAPGHPELHGYDTERVVEQSDIMPTVLSYIGYDKPYVAFGEDMLNVPAEDSFAIHWVPEGELYQTVYRNYAIDFDGKQVVHAYDYRADSLLTNDVRQTMPRETLKYMEELTKAVVQQYMWRMNTNNLVIK